MKNKINYYKIGVLILTLMQLIVVFAINKDLVKTNIWAWRLYVVCVIFISINVMFICTKQTRKVVK